MNTLCQYAIQFSGIPYKWGGRHPAEGLDCSEYVQILLRAAGELDYDGKDYTAQELFEWAHKNCRPNRYGPGALAFFGSAPNKVIHVGFCIDIYRMMEAGGGGRDCTTPEIAIQKRAMIRMSLMKSRADFLQVLKPYYSKIGTI